MDNVVYFGASKEIKKCRTCYWQRNFWLASSVRLFITAEFDVETKAEETERKRKKKSLRLRLELNDQNCNLYPNIFILCFYYNCTSSFCDTADWLLQMNRCQSMLFARSDDATDTFIAKPTVAKQSSPVTSVKLYFRPHVYFFALYCSCFAHISPIFRSGLKHPKCFHCLTCTL